MFTRDKLAYQPLALPARPVLDNAAMAAAAPVSEAPKPKKERKPRVLSEKQQAERSAKQSERSARESRPWSCHGRVGRTADG